MRGGLAVTVALIGVVLAASTGNHRRFRGPARFAWTSAHARGALSSRAFAAGTVCAVGTLGILIPPSIMLVLMADRLALSVGDLFLGAVCSRDSCWLRSMSLSLIRLAGSCRPEVAPAPESSRGPSMPPCVFSVFRDIVPAATLIFAVLGSIFFGIATPTEASGVGAHWAHSCWPMVRRTRRTEPVLQRRLSRDHAHDGLPVRHLRRRLGLRPRVARSRGRRAHRKSASRTSLRARAASCISILSHDVPAGVFPGLDRDHVHRPAPGRSRRRGPRLRPRVVHRALRRMSPNLVSHAARRLSRSSTSRAWRLPKSMSQTLYRGNPPLRRDCS